MVTRERKNKHEKKREITVGKNADNLPFASYYVKIKEYYLHARELYISSDI